MYKYRKSFSIFLLISILLNLVPQISGINNSYAEKVRVKKSGEELFDEYFPSNSFDNPKNWFVNTWKNGYGYNGGYLKKENKDSKLLSIYNIENNKLGSTIFPLSNGLRFNFRKHINKEAAEVYLMSKKEFKKDNLYELKFISDITDGKMQNLNFRVVTLKSDGNGRNNLKLESENINISNNNDKDSWSYIAQGDIKIQFLGRGEKHGIGFSMQGVADEVTRYELRKFSLENITPSSKPKIESDGLVGDKSVSGKVIKDKSDKRSNYEGDIVHILVNGEEVGKAIVDKNNNWKYEMDKPIKKGDKLEFYVEHPESGRSSEIVEHPYKKELHKPEIIEAKEGEEKVSGKGVPGDEIIIRDEEGKEIGRGEVDDEGNFKVELDRPLKDGEKITATPETKIGDRKETGEQSDNKEAEYNKELHKPEIIEVKEGKKYVTGNGRPGDEIIIRDKKREEIGKGKVDSEGNFHIEIDRELEKGEEITAVAKTGENESDETKVTVTYDANNHKPELNEVKEGDEKVSGKGTPGDEIVITDEEGEELGKGKVDEEENFEVELDRPLKEGETVLATPKTDGNKGTPSEKEVEYDGKNHKPELGEVKEGDETVSGKGTPGDEIVITDEEGKELGKGKVDSEGNFEVELDRPLKEGETVLATPKTDGKEGDSSEKEVGYNKEVHKPELDEVKEGDEKVSGKGTPGDEIVITDEEGKELGKGKVDSEGNFEIELDRPLKEGETVLATPKTDGKEGDSSEKEVGYNKELHKPEITEAKEGEKYVTGNGRPGDEIIIRDEKGEKIGKGKVDSEGNFHIEIDRELEKGEEIAAVAKTGENESDETKVTVTYEASKHKPELDDLKEGEEKVTGKGTPGDEIVIKDEKGEELGKGKVDSEGNFEVDLNRPLNPGEEIIAIPKTGENKGESTKGIVDYNKDKHKVEIIEAKEGEQKVKIKGRPGDEIVITDEKGNEIGRAKVEKGNEEFEIDLTRPLEAGEKITATPETEVRDKIEIGDSDEKTIDYDEESHKPELGDLEEGKEKVTGKGKPGDEIVIKDEEGEELGKGKVDSEGNFEIEVNRPLKPGEEITATPNTNGKEGTPVKEEVRYDKELHKPEITEAKEGEKYVTGNGRPGDEIIIRDDEGTELGRGIVDSEGNFHIEIDRELEKGEEIAAVAKTGENESDETKVTVTYEASKHKPELDDLKEGEEKVTGKGTPGDEIIIKDEKGKELGKGKVDSEGNFEIELDRPLNPGEDIIAIPYTNGNKGTPDKKEVGYDSGIHKPELDELIEDSTSVKGTGKPGDEIVIKDEEGEELGKGKVDSEGNFEIEVNRPLKPGEEITATPNTNGKEGTPVKEEVRYDKELHKPEITEAKEGEKYVTGNGRPGDEIIITDDEGTELGRGIVDSEGNFEIGLDRELIRNEQITAIPNLDGKLGEPGIKVVEYNPKIYKPDIKEAIGGEDKVTGTGRPGHEVVIRDEKANELGRGIVDSEGNFEIKTNRPLEEGEKINAVTIVGDEESEKTEVEVTYNGNTHKPELDNLEEGDDRVTGKGTPGDEIVITDENGKEIGRGKVDENGEFEVNLDRPLRPGEEIIATPETNGNKGKPAEKEVEYDPEAHKPEITEAKEEETLVKGTGVPGDIVVITDSEGIELGRGKVDDKGNFTIDLNRPLIENEKITATAEINGKKGLSDDKLVERKPSYSQPDGDMEEQESEEKENLIIDNLEEGDDRVTGKGTPGDEIVITDENGKEIGRGKVDENGEFEVNLDRPLRPGEEIIATPETNGNKGKPAEKEVEYDPEAHKPEITEAKEEETLVKGTGVPGDIVVITDSEGIELGRGKVDDKGNFTIDLNRPLIENEKITATAEINGKKGLSDDKLVERKRSTSHSGGGGSRGKRRKDKTKEEDTIIDNVKDGEKIEVIEPGNDKTNEHIAYIQGYEDGTVRPNDKISRQEVAAAIYRLLPDSQRSSYYTLNHEFKDIKENQWSRKHISTLANLRIVEGYNGKFRPNDNITRAELVAIVNRLDNCENGLTGEDSTKVSNFEDIEGHWAEYDIKLAASKGWIKGYEDGSYKPNQDITRAEFVTIVNNVLNRRIKKSDIPNNIKKFSDLEKEKWYYEAVVEASNSHYYRIEESGYEIWIEIFDGEIDW